MSKQYKIVYTKWGWTVFKRVWFFFWADVGPIYLSKDHAREAVKAFKDVEYY
jgi:hypothetical protein